MLHRTVLLLTYHRYKNAQQPARIIQEAILLPLFVTADEHYQRKAIDVIM